MPSTHGTITVSSNQDNIAIGEQFILSINSSDMRIASFELQIYFDNSKLEYLSGPDISNAQNNTILYTWVDKNGGNSPKQNEELVQFKFNATAYGEAVVGISGRFFNEHGEEITPTINQGIISIVQPVSISAHFSEEGEESERLYLETLAVEHYMIHPPTTINNDLNYTVRVLSTTENINILAIPENPNATVSIENVEMLQFGENIIRVAVTSEDGAFVREYTINAYRMNIQEEEQEMIRQEENMQRANQILATQQESESERGRSIINTIFIAGISVLIILIIIVIFLVIFMRL